MANAGMKPFQILPSGMGNPAIYLNAANDFGAVQVGKSADLILLEGNPLKDIANLSRRAGVMLRGQWLAESEIQKRLEAIAAMYVTK